MWPEKCYPNASVSERQSIAECAGWKTDASGAALPVWHDYVAGTDPTNTLSKFTTKIEMKAGEPKCKIKRSDFGFKWPLCPQWSPMVKIGIVFRHAVVV